jgi:hypothetical protein
MDAMKLTNVFDLAAVLTGLLPMVAGVSAQTYSPAIEYASLLDPRFYEQSGGFLVENLQLVFPPQPDQKMEFVITRSTGEAAATVPLRKESLGDVGKFPAFAQLQPNGVPGNVKVRQPGDFVMSVKANGQALTTLPFTLRAEGGDDPFNPQKTFVLEGPWRTLAYFFAPVDAPDAPLSFKWWMCARELPAGMKQSLCSVHLMRGSQEVAASRTKFDISDRMNRTWLSFRCELYLPTGGKHLTLPMLTAQDGDYTLAIKTKDNKIVKSCAVAVKGGKLQRLARCDLNFQPHTNFISPHLVDTSSGSSSRYRMVEAFWVETKSR